MRPELLLLFLFLQHCMLGGEAGLTLLTNSSCICPGQQLVFQCVTVGPAVQFTVWGGNALDCVNGISLRHGLFRDSGYANATCNNGAILARIVSIENNRYTSQLIVNTSLTLDGKMVTCSFDDGSTESLVGTRVIDILTEPYPPPLDVRLVAVQHGELTFNWTSADRLCQSLTFNIISYYCGHCPPITANSMATCTDVALDHVCTFYVQPVVCGNSFGNFSSPISVILKVPGVLKIESTPSYNHESRVLQTVDTRFDDLGSFTISDGFDNRITSYNITYSDSNNGNICGRITSTPAVLCRDGVCRHTFDVSSSLCHSSANITFTILPTTLLGAGPSSDPITINSRNNMFDIDTMFDGKTLTILCMFLEVTNEEKSCTISFGVMGHSRRCGNLTYTISYHRGHSNPLQLSVDVSRLLMEPVIETTCFVVTVSGSDYTAATEKKLTINSGCDADELSDGTSSLNLANGIQCDPPHFTTAIRNGLVCYTGTRIGSTAAHFCFDCDFGPADGASKQTTVLRTCMSNGTWTGAVPQCNCKVSMNTNTARNTAIAIGVVLLLIVTLFVTILTIQLVKSRIQAQRHKREMKQNEDNHDNMQTVIYEDITSPDPPQFEKNPSYDAHPPWLCATDNNN